MGLQGSLLAIEDRLIMVYKMRSTISMTGEYLKTGKLCKYNLKWATYGITRANSLADTAPVAFHCIDGNNGFIDYHNAVFQAYTNTKAASVTFIFIYFRFH